MTNIVGTLSYFIGNSMGKFPLLIDVGPGKTGLAENNLQSKEKSPSFYLSDFLCETSFAFFASGPTSIPYRGVYVGALKKSPFCCFYVAVNEPTLL
jgi:hypothetical protein